MAVSVDDVFSQITARGLRVTRQRRAVVAAVADSSVCLSPLEVFEAARRDCPDLGLTTVYRTLELLGEIGALRRVHGADGCERLVPAGSTHGHAVVCDSCGRVTEFTECDMGDVVRAATRETGYRITGHFLQLSGLCVDCAAQGDGGARAPAARPDGRWNEKGSR
ncbi:MAG TPA: Fur family transcriptional regulator [Thermoleophilia bacterium]|nr:Fur family transcriptional regulator [Thermoleophilia bacterium]HQJ97663.1 Fur family transcriptional regulator [Thermoleophilia bacterium]